MIRPSTALVALCGLPGALAAQTFQQNTTAIPTGGAANSSFTENLAFADVDLDGDLDVVWADGGDFGNDRNRLWINQGGAQGGAVGTFVDVTSAQLPAVLDDSRDVDFADFDGDGDLDFNASNTSGVSNQGSRFYVNQGGAQGGTAGFFAESTATAYVDLGVNDGVNAFSSVDPAIVLTEGNFIDWSCDTGFLDADNDGDLDLFNATYGTLSQGKVPSRVFLNDGAGHFEEFNPSGFQLTGTDIANGDPALWCEGLHQHDTLDTSGVEADVANIAISVDFGDLDGDFDVDVLHGEKLKLPRVFQNRSQENGGPLGFRDASHAFMSVPDWAPGVGSYEQDLGDLDDDGDLDIYGTNWATVAGPCDELIFNLGGIYGVPILTPNSCKRHNEPDFFDYDGDGDLDVFIASETSNELLYENLGPGGSWALVDQPGELPAAVDTSALGADTADVDQDGDYDVFVANDLGEANTYLENVSNVPDATAPRVPHLEQAPDRAAGFEPTVVRAHVYDNASWDVTQYATVELEYSVNGGATTAVPMASSGGQVFRGEIPGLTEGLIDYRVRAADAHGNTGVSGLLSYTAGPCNGDPLAYCTAKVNSAGCTPAIGWSGSGPSMTAGSGFSITCTDTLDNKSGLFFYGFAPKAIQFQGGWLCVQAPTKRTALQDSGGTPPCNGLFSFDFNAHIASGSAHQNVAAGVAIYGQYWSRDPAASFGTNRSDAIQFTICP